MRYRYMWTSVQTAADIAPTLHIHSGRACEDDSSHNSDPLSASSARLSCKTTHNEKGIKMKTRTMQAIQTIQAYKPLGQFRGAGLAIMALACAAVITLLLTWAPSSMGRDTAAPGKASGVQAQTAGAIEAPAEARRVLDDAIALKDAPAHPTCAALGKSAQTAYVSKRAQPGSAVGCGVPDSLATVSPPAIGAASQ